MTRTVHLVEPSQLGHRPFFVRWLLSGPPGDIRWVWHCHRRSLAHPALAEVLRQPPPGLRIAPMTMPPESDHIPADFTGLFRLHYSRARAYHRHFAALRIPRQEPVLLPFLDDVTYALACAPWLLAGRPITAIGMVEEFHHRAMGIAAPVSRLAGLKEQALLRLLERPTLRCYLTDNLPLRTYLVERYPHLRRRIAFLPDPGEPPQPTTRAAARATLGWPAERRVLLAYGSQTLRKGPRQLLTLLGHPAWPAHCIAVVAGRQDPATKALYQSPAARAAEAAGRLLCLPHRIDAGTENLLFQAADVVWLAYHGHYGASGVMVQAGLHARPVLACEDGLIGWYVARFGGGIHCRKDTDPGTIIARLAGLLADASAQSAAGEGMRRAFQRHDLSTFRRIVHQALGSRSPA